MIRVADYFINFLAERGVKAAFMVASGHNMHLIDAVARCPSMKYYCNHHEQASAFAADAHARMAGIPSLCISGSNGSPNLITGIVGAYQDSIPIVFLTGTVKTADLMWNKSIGLRQKGVFEVNIAPIAQSVTKYAESVRTADSARLHMEWAWYSATTGRPGPVLLDVPLDIQGAMIDPEKIDGYIPYPAPKVVGNDADKVIAKLMNANRPLIWAGHGVRCAKSVHAFRLLVDRLNIPVVTTQLAKDLLPHSHHLFVGHPGIKGDRAANLAVQHADVILVLGSSLHIQNIGWESALFAPKAFKIHVDPDGAILAKTKPITSRQILADVGSFIDAMLGVDYEEKLERVLFWNQKCSEWKDRPETHRLASTNEAIDFYEVMDILSDLLPDNAVIITDAGQPIYIVPQGLRLKQGQRYLTPGSLAEMGWALPAAIGAAVADPERMVVAIIGDGSLQFNIQELQTIRHHNLNIKVVVINNGGYASIRATQDRFFDGFRVGSSQETGISLPDLDKIAAAYKIPYICSSFKSINGHYMSSPGYARNVLSNTLNRIGPVICEVISKTDQKISPTVESIRMPDGSMKSAALDEMTPPIPSPDVEDLCKKK